MALIRDWWAPRSPWRDLTVVPGLSLTVGPSASSSTSPRQRGAFIPQEKGEGEVPLWKMGNRTQGSEGAGFFAKPRRGVCRMGCGPSPKPLPGPAQLDVVASCPEAPRLLGAGPHAGCAPYVSCQVTEVGTLQPSSEDLVSQGRGWAAEPRPMAARWLRSISY